MMTSVRFDTACALMNGVWVGNAIQRYPDHVRTNLSKKGQTVARSSGGAELRFVTDAAHIELDTSVPHPTRLHVIIGGRYAYTRVLHPKRPTIRLDLFGERRQLAKTFPDMPYHPDVIRLCFDATIGERGFQRVEVRDLRHDGSLLRPPQPGEQPDRTILFYGSSITHGTKASNLLHTYPNLCGEQLGMNVLNKALAGSCQIESTTADYLASLDYDYAVFELGVNTRRSLSENELKKRVKYLLEAVRQSHPDIPIVVLSILPNLADLMNDDNLNGIQSRFRSAIADVCCTTDSNVLHIPAEPLLDWNGLSADLVHPSDRGYLQIARRLIRAVNDHLRGE